MSDNSSEKDSDFAKRREEAMARVQLMDKDVIHANPEREQFFETVYEDAEGDAAAVPWADLEAKDKLDQWLKQNPKTGSNAIDVGCGLGDNAEAISAAGWDTVAFDFSPKAIDWAKTRFPDTSVKYQVADLFDLPSDWIGKFDLVHECYTMQSIPPETLEKSLPAIASLVAPGGTLLVYTRIREDGGGVDGPPWPLEESSTGKFSEFGFQLVDLEEFTIERPGRLIPHKFFVWQKR
ncbi:MAG: class I SAM-dependent methyltransferase [Pseudomonadota bacterium]